MYTQAWDLVEDARVCIDHLIITMGAEPEHIILFGHSIGGAVASQLRADHSPSGPLVVDRSFSNLGDAASSVFGMLRAHCPRLLSSPPPLPSLLPLLVGDVGVGGYAVLFSSWPPLCCSVCFARCSDSPSCLIGAAGLRCGWTPASPTTATTTFRARTSAPAPAPTPTGLLCKSIIGFELKVPVFCVIGIMNAMFKGRMDAFNAWKKITGPRLVIYHVEDAVIRYEKSSLHYFLEKDGCVRVACVLAWRGVRGVWCALVPVLTACMGSPGLALP